MKSVYPVKLLHIQPLLVVDVNINGKGPFHFSVDTGASVSVVTPATARIAGIKYGPKKGAMAVSASTRTSTVLSQIEALEIGGLTISRLDVAIISLATVNRATHLHLGGILGHNFLSRYTVTIDYGQKLMSLQALRDVAS